MDWNKIKYLNNMKYNEDKSNILCLRYSVSNIRCVGIGDWGLGIGDWGLGQIPKNEPNIPILKIFINILSV
jgi:hypothetical protein